MTLKGERCKRGVSQRAGDRPAWYCRTHLWQHLVYADPDWQQSSDDFKQYKVGLFKQAAQDVMDRRDA
jgi:hypothetical protein